MRKTIHHLHSNWTASDGQMWFESSCDFEVTLEQAARARVKDFAFTTKYSEVTCEDCKEAIGMDVLADCP